MSGHCENCGANPCLCKQVAEDTPMTDRAAAYLAMKRGVLHIDTSIATPDPEVLARLRALSALHPGAWRRALRCSEDAGRCEGIVHPAPAAAPEGQAALFELEALSRHRRRSRATPPVAR